MISYTRAQAPVRENLRDAHQRFWDRLARPGAWWTSAERIAIARETRAAPACGLCRRRREALSPHVVPGRHDAATDLPEAVVEVVHAVTGQASRLTRDWYSSVLERGVSPEAYVEVVGTVVALVSIDRFCRALGLDPHPLPAPGTGAPSRYRPARAGSDEAWVPMVPADNSGTPEADLWPARRGANVIRALSLVPDEVRTLNDLGAAHYLPSDRVRDASASAGALSRPQMELVAGRVTALNDCFY